MKKMSVKVVIIFLLGCFLCGCSLPSMTTYSSLPNYTRKEERKKRAFASEKKYIVYKDFRLNELYEEDVAAYKVDVEEFIVEHPNLAAEKTSVLRELTVVPGLNKEEVILLLGSPDKIIRPHNYKNYGVCEKWIYKIKKWRTFNIFIVPVFPVHEAYYIYLKDGVVAAIEKHYLTQIFQQGSAPGVFSKENKGLPKSGLREK